MTDSFRIQSGTARVATISKAIHTDQFAILYRPGSDDGGFNAQCFIPFPKWGGAPNEPTFLTIDNPLVILHLPGLYKIVPVGTPSDGVDVDVSDDGFAFNLGRSV